MPRITDQMTQLHKLTLCAKFVLDVHVRLNVKHIVEVIIILINIIIIIIIYHLLHYVQSITYYLLFIICH